ncbi:hypothetical protein QUB63_16835 [Microcoleus sp. ARI1-B5]
MKESFLLTGFKSDRALVGPDETARGLLERGTALAEAVGTALCCLS